MITDYTDDELRQELRRRAAVRRKEAAKSRALTSHWKYYEGVVTKIVNARQVCNIEYIVDSEYLQNSNWKSLNNWKAFRALPGVFNKNTIPKIGDTVILRHRLYVNPKRNGLNDSKIIGLKEVDNGKK